MQKEIPMLCIKTWGFSWRSGWDSNPRTVARHLISSQGRCDHFDTAPKIFPPWFSPCKLERKSGEKARGSNLFKALEALKNKDFRQVVFQIAGTISSQSRYDHFDTAPEPKNSIPWAAKDCKGGFSGKKRRQGTLTSQNGFIMDFYRPYRKNKIEIIKGRIFLRIWV